MFLLHLPFLCNLLGFLEKIQNKNQTDECTIYDTLGVAGLRSSLSQRRDVQSSAVPVTVSGSVSISYAMASSHFLSPPKGGMEPPLLYNVESC